jgi:hypothetical protein
MIPKKVKIAGFIVPVRIAKKIKGGYIGQAHYEGNKILLAQNTKYNKISSQAMHECFCHEILHHISVRYSVKLSESQIEKLSEGLYQVIKDNKLKF